VSNQGRDSSDSVVSLLAGIGVGVLLGSVVALLLAPQSGTQTRTQLKESADDAIGRLRESMDDLRVKVEEMSSTAKETLVHRRGGGGQSGPDALPAQGDAVGQTDENSDGSASAS